MALLKVASKDDFQKYVNDSKKLVLVDFWAEWCPPCKAMEPALESLSKKLDADVDIVKVNIEESAENGALAQEHGVQGIPNMQLFKNGKKVDELIGMRPEKTLEDDLSKHL
mgnify:CR=1 FL=1